MIDTDGKTKGGVSTIAATAIHDGDANGELKQSVSQSAAHFQWDHMQDVMGQLRLLKSYSHAMFIFGIPEETSRESIEIALESAAQKLTAGFPWLAGKVVHEGTGPGNSGLFRVAYCEKWAAPNSILRIKDCTKLCPSYQEIMRTGGPVTMFDPEVLAPTVAFPQSYQESEEEPAFVCALQASFIDGGVILDIATQHNIMDGIATYQAMRLLAKALRGESFSPKEVEQGNRDRRNMVQLLGPDEPLHDIVSNYSRPSTLGMALPAVPAPQGRWCFFRVKAQSLVSLKNVASNPDDLDADVPFISTNDALSAFIWKRVGTIRRRRLQDPSAISKLSRACDARASIGVPPEYMGNMVCNSFNRLSLRELDELPLGKIACVMRKNLKRDVSEHTVRSLATLVHNSPDKTKMMYGGVQNPATDVAFTSIAHMDIYSVNFGPLGLLSLHRRPNFIPKATTVYLWPKTLEGDIDGLICLTEEELLELKRDTEWGAVAQLIE